MKLTFLGTRGNIEARSRRHRNHTSLGVSYRGRFVLVDCGEDWLGRLSDFQPRAVVVTHAHPDHAGGLAEGAPCPVYATWETRIGLERLPVDEWHVIEPREPFAITGIRFEAFPVVHSVHSPAVGYRIGADGVEIFYAPDLLSIGDRDAALGGIDLYVGDGAHLTRPIARGRGDRRIGHAPVRAQLDWCAEAGVRRFVVTHCGSQIVKGDERTLGAELRRMARERGIEAEIAHDGMELVLR